LSRLGYTACGCELSRFYIQTYAKKNPEDFIVCDAQLLPFFKKRVDLITAFELVEHLPKYHQFFDQCYDILKEGGALIMTTPNSTLRPLNLKFWRDYSLGTLLLNNHNIDGHFHEFSSSSELKMNLGLQRFKQVIVETWWFAPVPPTLFDRYFVGQLPLFMIPHFRCLALK
jgi:predicted SAM-dependent methyltransferase